MALEHVVAFAGGVGGAKLADGLAQILPPGALTVIVNIGDDFEHYGLHISPDLDTVMYTLAEVANPETGWGLAGESWQMLGMMERYGEMPWFRLGDRDVATHLMRISMLKEGHTLTKVTKHLSKALGIQQTILPVSDKRLSTMIDTVEGETLAFQDYFVRQRWQPVVKRIWYNGGGNAEPSSEMLAALDQADAIVICPSNPVLSIEPMLIIGDLRQRLEKHKAIRVAVSPLIHGQAVKGPAQKIMTELGLDASTAGLQKFYRGLIDGMVVERGDALDSGSFLETDIMMKTRADRARLAREVLDWIGRLQK
jgi:LPPG:FO 2-phospho-L-lactate transferase